MKRLFIFAVGVLFVLTIKAQGQVEIAVAIPRQTTEVSHNTWNVIRNKLVDAMTRNGVSSVVYSGIVVYPEIMVSDEQSVESGMRNITVIDIQLSLTTEHVVTGTVFSTLTLTLRGEGDNMDKAMIRAINKILPTDERLNDFMVLSRNKITRYYQENTNTIIQKAQNLALTKQYEAALALLSSYPTSASGYVTVSKALTAIYGQYQNSICTQVLQQARAAYSLGNYAEAASYLQQVDMQSSCAKEARALCQKIKASRDTEAARELATFERIYQNQADLEKQRIKAIRDVAVAYYKSVPRFYYVF